MAFVRALRVYVLACSPAWWVCVLTCLACLLACVLGVLVWLMYLRVRVVGVLCIRLLCLHACYDACLACLALAYSCFCLIYFVCINQGFVNQFGVNTKIMKKFVEIYLMTNFPKWSDTKFRVSLKTVKLTKLSSEMDKKCY